ncbi:glycosyltransferase family 2 protein [Candidatus Uhrbacteria bacterium]|nr:glycosyltransferase family 2 protein [Candidatus Uhrbacteria bacterium]
MKTIAVIPAYNEEKTIGGVVKATLPFVSRVIVVDDGSTDETGPRARDAGALVLRHLINRGLGATLGTGIAAALGAQADLIVTLDADGQHDATEIPTLVFPIERGFADVVLGSRMLKGTGMPVVRRVANHLGNFITLAFFGLFVTDSQSGFRAFSARAAQKIEIRSNRMEVSSEIIAEIRRKGLRVAEVPIRSIYTAYSLSKGQSFWVGVKTACRLILRRLGK